MQKRPKGVFALYAEREEFGQTFKNCRHNFCRTTLSRGFARWQNIAPAFESPHFCYTKTLHFAALFA
jgi:hypothetical protein